MLIIPPTSYRRRRRLRRRAGAAGPGALVLVSAEVVTYEPFVFRLTFDRAIDVSALEPSQFVVDDPSGTGFRYVGFEVADTPDAQSVELGAQTDGGAQGTLDVLTAGAANGIVAAGDGAAWPGVTNLGLPYSG